MIAAVSPEGVIGLNGTIPWHYRGDMQRFKRLTLGKAVVMGRLTWESMPKRPLPGRRNVVISSRPLDGVETYRDVSSALRAIGPGGGDVWFIGGARVYAEAMEHCDRIDLTYVPDHVVDPRAVRFPPIDPEAWEPGPRVPHEDEPALTRQEFTRRRC